MSHTTEIKGIVFNDMVALQLAVIELNAAGIACSLQENAKPRAYYSAQEGMGVAPYMLKLDNSRYDVGFYEDTELKGYVARTDLFGGDVARQLGVAAAAGGNPQQAAMGKLYQGYAVSAACRQAAKQGYRVRRQTKPDGTIQLIMSA
jgi:hypothetical protein